MKLLIVDDSKFSQIVASNLFKKIDENVEIIFANDGKEGFEKYKDNKPNYSIIDLLMPKLNGKELIKLIKEYDKDAKLFVVSADVQNSVKEEVLSYGIMGFINKPLNEEKVKSIYDIIKGDNNEG